MFSALNKVYTWTKVNSKWVLLSSVVLLLVFLIFWWGRKNKKIRSLENALAILKSRVKLERLAVKHGILVEELDKLKEKDFQLKQELYEIELNLNKKLSEDMTLEEISKKLNEIKK